MGRLKKFLIFILVINILVFYSCEPGELQLKIDEIIFENGKNEFDQKTLYLRAKNPQNIPGHSGSVNLSPKNARIIENRNYPSALG